MQATDYVRLRTLSKVILAMFIMVSAGLFYWTVVRAEIILSRNDNPRLLEQEIRIQRGAILDRNGVTLAFSEGDSGRFQRKYPLPDIGPVIGFYSIIHGTAGVESGFNEFLRNDPGDWLTSFSQSTFHLDQIGQSIKLALDTHLQLTADTALGQEKGAVLLLEIDSEKPNTAWIRALVSHPGFDPNSLDEQFDALGAMEDAPLLNRVTQGQYQPGLLLQPFILAAALEQKLITLTDDVLNPNQPVEINGFKSQCKNPPPNPASWSDIIQFQCPGPMIDLADQLGVSGLDAAIAAFGLDRDPVLEIDTETTPDEPIENPLLAGIGQDNLSITPLKIGLAMSALVNNGQLPQPQLGLAIENSEGIWQPWFLESSEKQAISAESAAQVLDALRQADTYYEHSSLVLSGPDEMTNAWYLGAIKDKDVNFVAVVVLEDSKLEDQAVGIGRKILSAARES